MAFGPGQIHKLAEFLNSDQLSAQGYFEFEDFAGHLPSHRARQFQGWLRSPRGCNCVCSYQVSCLRPGGGNRAATPGSCSRKPNGWRLMACGNHPAGPERQLLRRDLPKEKPDPVSDLLGMIDAVDGLTGSGHQSASKGHARRRDRGSREPALAV